MIEVMYNTVFLNIKNYLLTIYTSIKSLQSAYLNQFNYHLELSHANKNTIVR